MPLLTYAQTRPWAAAIREAVKLRKMPPWFADPKHGVFSNDARLSEDAIERVEAWAKAGSPAGSKADAPTSSGQGKANVRLPSADMILTAQAPFVIPANAVVDYQYLVLPLTLSSDKWVRGVEIQPSDRRVVHHAVLYVREAGSHWLKEALPGKWYAPARDDPGAVQRTRDTKEDILAIYTPGAPAARFPEKMAKKLPAAADLVLQVHYTSTEARTADKPRIVLSFAENEPTNRIITLQMGRDDLRIPPGEAMYRASVSGTLPRDALLISMFPHMHLRGSAFEFDIVGPKGHVETLLRVKPYNFNWQLNYVLETPRLLNKGAVLRWTGYFDNSRNNANNPDPTAEVTWGEQSWDEMMIGFFDVAVDPHVTKQDYFVR